MAKASIIIPVYNKERYLGETLSLVDKQQEDDLEVIIIDDCSEDHSMDIITDFASNTKKQVKVIQNDQNMGVAYNRNMGVEESKSEYITFLDADDLLDKNFMSIMLEKADQYPNVDYICGLHVPFKEQLSSRAIHKMSHYFEYEENYIINPRVDLNYIAMSNVACNSRLYRKSSIQNIKFVESHFEDYEFFFDTIASELKCLYTTKPVYGYRVIPEGKYQSSLSNICDSCIDYFDIYDRIEKKYPNMNDEIHALIRGRHIYICQEYLKRILSVSIMEPKDLTTFARNYKRYLDIRYDYYGDNFYDIEYMRQMKGLSKNPEVLKRNIKKIAMKYSK